MKKKGVSLKIKLLAGILLPIAFIFLLIILVLNIQIGRDIKESMEENAIHQINTHAMKFSYWLGSYKRWLNNISQDPELPEIIESGNLDRWLEIHCLKEKGGNIVCADVNGDAVLYRKDKRGRFNIKAKSDYKEIIGNKNKKVFIGDAFVGQVSKIPMVVMSKGVIDKNNNIVGLINTGISVESLNSFASEGKVTENSIPWIIDGKGLILAYPSDEIRLKMNFKDFSEKLNYKGYKELEEKIISSKESDVANVFDEVGNENIIVWAPVPDTPGWTIGITIPKKDFMKLSYKISSVLILFFIVALMVLTVIIIIVLLKILKPTKVLVSALKNISEGDGDLTVRLPIKGNDELSEVASYFNNTIEKIQSSMKAVLNDTEDINKIGQTLSQNMNTTASSINQINMNIDNVREQILDQSFGITETSDTMAEIIKAINKLNASIETQAASVTESSSSIEEMLANITSISKMLTETSKVMQDLAEDVFHKVVDLTSDLSKRVESVVHAIQEQDRGSKQVLTAIQEINQVTSEVKSRSEEMFRGGNQVAKEMSKLDDLSNRITNSMTEMDNGAKQINYAVQEVKHLTEKNEESLKDLSDQVSKFKV